MGTHPIFESDFDCLTECARYGDHSLVEASYSESDGEREKRRKGHHNGGGEDGRTKGRGENDACDSRLKSTTQRDRTRRSQQGAPCHLKGTPPIAAHQARGEHRCLGENHSNAQLGSQSGTSERIGLLATREE